jgi:hypothetical protein
MALAEFALFIEWLHARERSSPFRASRLQVTSPFYSCFEGFFTFYLLRGHYKKGWHFKPYA